MNLTTKLARIFSLLFVLTAVCIFIGSTSAQTPKKEPPKAVKAQEKDDKEDELPVKADYDRVLNHYTEWSKKFNDEDYWKNVVLTRVSDKKEVKIKDLSDFDKNGFYLSNLRRCTFEMKRLDGFWQEELKQYTKKAPTQKGVPTTDELKKYIGTLTTLRKDTAVKLEEFAGKFVKQFPDKITKEEGEQLLKSIKDYHDENKLIERKK